MCACAARLLGMTAYAAEITRTASTGLRLPSPTSLSGRLAAARAQRADDARRLAQTEYAEAVALVESVLGSAALAAPSVVPLPHSNSMCRTKGCGRTARMVIVVPGELSTEACSPCAAKIAQKI